MTDKQKKILLETARNAVLAAVSHGEMIPPKSSDPQLNAGLGCFVTLKNGGTLRGCIGQFTSDAPLIETVARMAWAAAVEDSRFFAEPILTDEVDRLNVEISVLSPLKKTSDPLSLRLGIDGIYIKKGIRTGCFLPQVATETGWSAEEFLSYCCGHKAGLPPDAWKDKDTEVYLFTAEIIGEQ